MKKSLKIKIITGFREDQYYTIDIEEAHKAYYLFMNPEKRGIFSNGVAIIGKNIQGIEPDWNATMGWTKGYKIGVGEFQEISKAGIDRIMREKMQQAKSVTYKFADKPELMGQPLSKIVENNIKLIP